MLSADHHTWRKLRCQQKTSMPNSMKSTNQWLTFEEEWMKFSIFSCNNIRLGFHANSPCPFSSTFGFRFISFRSWISLSACMDYATYLCLTFFLSCKNIILHAKFYLLKKNHFFFTKYLSFRVRNVLICVKLINHWLLNE